MVSLLKDGDSQNYREYIFFVIPLTKGNPSLHCYCEPQGLRYKIQITRYKLQIYVNLQIANIQIFGIFYFTIDWCLFLVYWLFVNASPVPDGAGATLSLQRYRVCFTARGAPLANAPRYAM